MTFSVLLALVDLSVVQLAHATSCDYPLTMIPGEEEVPQNVRFFASKIHPPEGELELLGPDGPVPLDVEPMPLEERC